MTKPIISVRALQLLEAGKLRLDSPISTWLPAFKHMFVSSPTGIKTPANRQITIEDLLLHRSGLSYDFLPDCAIAALYRDAELAADGSRPLADLVGVLAQLPLAHQPGTRWYYSYSTDVLAHVIEKITDEPIADSLSREIFRPLGMSETAYEVARENKHRLVSMFGQRDLGEEDTSSATENTLNTFDVERSYPSGSSL